MKKLHISILFLILIFNFFSQPKEIKILFTGNTYGKPLRWTDYTGKSKGGIPARKTVIDSIVGKEKKENYILLSTGNILSGYPEAFLTGYKTEIEGMNKLGYDMMAIGFTDIYQSFTNYKNINKISEFYFVNSNILNKNANIADQYYVKTINGIKVAVFSILSNDAVFYLRDSQKKEFTIEEQIKQLGETLDSLIKNEKPAIIIGVTTLGFYNNSNDGVNKLLNKFPKINIIIENNYFYDTPFEKINNSYVCKVIPEGLGLGYLNIKYQNGKIEDVGINYLNIDDQVSEDKNLLDTLSKLTGNINKQLENKVGSLKSGKLTTKNKSNSFSSLALFVTDCIKDYTNSDIAFINNGGLAEIELQEKTEITRRSFDKLFKYNNYVTVMKLNGKTLKDTIYNSLKMYGYGQFLTISGVKIVYNKDDYLSSEITINGKPIEDNAIYKVATSDYIANGGDGYTMLKEVYDKYNTGMLVKYMVLEQIALLKTINYKEQNNFIVK